MIGALHRLHTPMVRWIARLVVATPLALSCLNHVRAAELVVPGISGERGFAGTTPRLQVRAARGNARAQTMLGFAYETGSGVPQNYDMAAVWYRRAAMSGNPTAQYLLGLAYNHGHGVPRDNVIAHKWLILATAGASSHEREYFVRIRDAVAYTMTAEEIAESQFLALQWTEIHNSVRAHLHMRR